MKFTRRSFFAGLGAASLSGLAPSGLVAGQRYPGDISPNSYASLIDLVKCDGCKGREKPECVRACRSANSHKFPEPDPAMLKPYWPLDFYDDWSDKREVFDQLTPYNWLFVQRITVEDGGRSVEVTVPRRCMHCDNPPCAKLCPFGVMHKHKAGMVTIDPFLCFGGSKCKAVCPWSIPQRQAGVGIYTYLDPLPVGGGVLFKCDLCKDRLDRGENPACFSACPRGAMTFGTRASIDNLARQLASGYNGYIYGQTENGGTSTVYVSKIPFEKLQAALLAQAEPGKRPIQLHNPTNMLEKSLGWARLSLLGPAAGALAAFVGVIAGRSKKDNENKLDALTEADTVDKADSIDPAANAANADNADNGDKIDTTDSERKKGAERGGSDNE